MNISSENYVGCNSFFSYYDKRWINRICTSTSISHTKMTLYILYQVCSIFRIATHAITDGIKLTFYCACSLLLITLIVNSNSKDDWGGKTWWRGSTV